MTPTHWTLLIVPAAHVAGARAVFASLSETGDAGTTFTTELNATGSPDDPVTHYASGAHVGPQFLESAAGIAAMFPGAMYYPPAPTATRNLTGAWAWVAEQGLRVITAELP